MVCPGCSESSLVFRSRRRGWEFILKLLKVYAYHCSACDARFYRRVPE